MQTEQDDVLQSHEPRWFDHTTLTTAPHPAASLLKSPGLWTNWRRDCGVHTKTFSLGDIVHTLHSNSQYKPLFVLLASITDNIRALFCGCTAAKTSSLDRHWPPETPCSVCYVLYCALCLASPETERYFDVRHARVCAGSR